MSSQRKCIILLFDSTHSIFKKKYKFIYVPSPTIKQPLKMTKSKTTNKSNKYKTLGEVKKEQSEV